MEIKGVAEPHYGPDEDGLVFDDGRYLGITNLVRFAAGTDSPEWNVYWGAEIGTAEEEQAFGQNSATRRLKEWRIQSKEKWPPVFRVRIVMEAEPLSQDELETYWTEKRRKHQEFLKTGR